MTPDEALVVLGLQLPAIPRRVPFEEASAQFSRWRDAEVKRIRREAAKRLHPDVHPDGEGGAELARINAALDLLEKLHLRPPPPLRRRVIVLHGGASSATTTTATGDLFTSSTVWLRW